MSMNETGPISPARLIQILNGLGTPITVQLAAILAKMDNPADPMTNDVLDRAARLLGVIYGSQGQQLLQRAATFDTVVQLRDAGVELDPRDRNWVLGGLDVPDLSNRWARQLGLVDLSRVLGAALTSANPVITGIFDAAGNRMPAMDAAIRPGFVDVIDRAARLLGVIYGDVGSLRQNAARSAYTIEETPTAILHGQVTLTGAAQQFPDGACLSVTVENPSANTVVAIGNSNAVTLLLGYRLQPGATISLDIDNLNKIWVIGTAAEIISYIGVN